MPLYFFHLKDGTDTIIDAEGVNLAGAQAAREYALVQARDIIAHEVLKGRIDLTQRIDVFDEAETLACSLDFAEAVEILK